MTNSTWHGNVEILMLLTILSCRKLENCTAEFGTDSVVVVSFNLDCCSRPLSGHSACHNPPLRPCRICQHTIDSPDYLAAHVPGGANETHGGD